MKGYNGCECSDYTFVKEERFVCDAGAYNLEVIKCNDCGKRHYGYDGWYRDDWQSLADVKAYLRSL